MSSHLNATTQATPGKNGQQNCLPEPSQAGRFMSKQTVGFKSLSFGGRSCHTGKRTKPLLQLTAFLARPWRVSIPLSSVLPRTCLFLAGHGSEPQDTEKEMSTSYQLDPDVVSESPKHIQPHFGAIGIRRHIWEPLCHQETDTPDEKLKFINIEQWQAPYNQIQVYEGTLNAVLVPRARLELSGKD